MVGVKWVSYDIHHYANMLVLFADKFNFINNGGIMSIRLSGKPVAERCPENAAGCIRA